MLARCHHSIRKWETSSDAVTAATYSHLCRALDVLEGEGARFSGDRVSALFGDSPDYLMEAVPPPSTPNDSKGLHLGMDLAARVRHTGVSHARHVQESRFAKVLRWCAARLLLRTLTDEFAFRRISRIDVRVLPIQIEHHWQDIAASTPPLPCADYLAVTKAQD